MTTADTSDFAAWESRHLYYAGDATAVVKSCVLPFALSLRSLREVNGFFFVRFRDETGAHVRLRLRYATDAWEAHAAQGVKVRVAELLDQVLGDYAAAAPPAAAELATDPAALDLPPLPRVSAAKFEPEIERYGGARALGFSLDFFSLSSAYALAFVTRYGDRPRSRQVTLWLCLLFWQAWGFSRDEAELMGLLQYRAGEDTWEAAAARADQVFDKEAERWSTLVAGQLTSLAEADETFSFAEISLESCACVAAASRLLARELQEIDEDSRVGIGASQLHMTANRLGLSNWEENFITRILLRSLMHLAATEAGFPPALRRVLDRSRQRSAARPETLRDLIPLHFAALD